MVVAQDAAATGQGVVVQVAGGLELAERAQVDGQVMGGVQGVGVVVAQHAAATGQGVVVQVAGGLELAERAQVDGQVVGGVQGVGVVVAQDAAAAGQGVVVQVAGGLGSPSARRSWANVVAEDNVLRWSWPRMRRWRARVSWFRSRAAWTSPSLRRLMARLWAE